MDKIFEELLKHLAYVPKYFAILLQILVRPRAYLSALPESDDEQLAPALIFLAISCVILTLATLPFAAAKEATLLFIAARGAVLAIMMVAYSLAVHVSWRIVGGKESFARCLILSSYISSVGSLILLVFLLVAISAVISFDPALYQAMNRAGSEPVELTGFQVQLALGFVTILALGVIVTTAWFAIAWGAYRDANGVSRWRSFLAFCLAGIFVIPVFAATILVSQAIAVIAQRAG
jgi:hypothetical protein